MLLMRGATSDLKVMAESVGSVGHAVSRSSATVVQTESSFKKTNKNLPANKNNNKASDNFKSQSPSEDKTIQYGALPCETDHMYHTNFTDDSSKYRELANEVANLKALVLFHLDLIQQQSECNAAKDKQLSALKHENEMLQQKLERMERRVQLQTSKQKNEVIVEDNFPTGKITDPSLHQSGSAVTGNMIATRTQSKVSGSSSVPHIPDQQQSFPNCDKLPTVEEIPRKRIKTLLPVRTKPCPSPPPAKRRRTTKSLESSESEDQTPVVLPNDNILDDLINQAVEEGAIINLNDTNVPSDHIIEAKVVLEPCALPVLLVEKESVPSEPNALDTPIHPEHKRIQECLAQKPPIRESAQLKKEVILTTEEPYLTHLGESFREPEVVTNEAQVEVPRWIIKPLSGRTAAHGIENLDDEVFSKRHLKHEVDEKRRKRWDLQRFREQRQYEKLRARYEGEDRSQDRIRTQAPAELSSTSGTHCGTLWAGPEDVTHIQVEAWLPVSVFGIPLPNIAPADFQLPWSSSRSGDLQEPLTKRRQRRSYKAE